MKLSNLKNSFWAFAMAIGFVIAAIVTLLICLREWLENPSGIFHDFSGTNWSLLYDVGISWFVPAFIYASLIAALLHVLYSFIQSIEHSLASHTFLLTFCCCRQKVSRTARMLCEKSHGWQ